MIVYLSNFSEFSDIVLRNQISETLVDQVQKKLGIGVSQNEVLSWRNSLVYIRNALDYAEVPEDCGIAIEFQIPLTSKRVDVLVSGTDESGRTNVLLVELKQWETAQLTQKADVLKTRLGGSLVETTHPSYQAWSYSSFITDYNEAVQTNSINLQPCAYLHNAVDDQVLKDSKFSDILARAPLFLKNEVPELSEFVRKYIRQGDAGEALYELESGRLRPSKHLIQYLASLLQGNKEFTLLDEQKIAAETILDLDKKAQNDKNAENPKRQVLIVEGGPGTGKSILAINLLAQLTAKERVAHYVTRNTAPREVFESKLTGSFTRSRIRSMFKSAGSFISRPSQLIDVLLVDEAHRLCLKSGPFGNIGENQIREIIEAAHLSVFFIDEAQKVIFKDIGSREEILRWAWYFNAEVTDLKLESQFRCNGSNGYLAWIDHILRVRNTAHPTLQDVNYDFRVFDSPNELYDEIEHIDQSDFTARVVAGYCWEWVSKADPDRFDIEIPGHDFKRRWNLSDHGNYWIVTPESISEIGCIHTCQGLELDYIGVIIGEDLIVRDGKVITDPTKRAKSDRSLRGYLSQLDESPIETQKKVDAIIKNTYRTLMTRGMRGCYIYCADQETNEFFKSQLTNSLNPDAPQGPR